MILEDESPDALLSIVYYMQSENTRLRSELAELVEVGKKMREAQKADYRLLNYMEHNEQCKLQFESELSFDAILQKHS